MTTRLQRLTRQADAALADLDAQPGPIRNCDRALIAAIALCEEGVRIYNLALHTRTVSGNVSHDTAPPERTAP